MKRLALAIVLMAIAGQWHVDAQSAPDRSKVLRAAADALGMVRWADIGTTTTRLPGIDIVNTMEFHGSGTVEIAGQAAKADYHAAIGYNPPGTEEGSIASMWTRWKLPRLRMRTN